jgi:hypothetical protein
MKAKVIQVKTYGRTGSNLITNYFSTIGYQVLNASLRDKIEEQLSYGQPTIVHDHSPDYVIPLVENQTVCLFVKRRDMTAQFLSMQVANHYNFFHDMDNELGKTDSIKPVEIKPFRLDKKECLFQARVFKEWHHNAAVTLANSNIPFIALYYEDFVNDLDYFSFLHNRPGFKVLERPEKRTSIQAVDVIENYEEVVGWLMHWNLNNGVY